MADELEEAEGFARRSELVSDADGDRRSRRVPRRDVDDRNDRPIVGPLVGLGLADEVVQRRSCHGRRVVPVRR